MRGRTLRAGAGVLAIAVIASIHDARSQPNSLQGAWVEEGLACTSVFTAGRKAIGFKKPTSPFWPAFIISGRRLSTPLASCHIVAVRPSGERQIMNLRCTTSVAMDAARAILAPSPDGSLQRFFEPEGGTAAKYQRCRAEDLQSMAPETWSDGALARTQNG